MLQGIRYALLPLLLVAPPLVGVVLGGLPLARYLEFPPLTRYLDHAPFSWALFLAMAGGLLILLAPLGLRAMGALLHQTRTPSAKHPFPWWGHLGLAIGILAWILAWTRFSWFAPFQKDTFTPLWIGYILVMNSLSVRRTGSCLMLQEPKRFALLFPLSVLFWWYFEYLNRFVQSWQYLGITLTPLSYGIRASVCFSTVLPAVLSTRQWLLSFPWVQEAFTGIRPLALRRPRKAAIGLLGLSVIGLGLLGLFPDLLFPLLWMGPLGILLSFETLNGRRHVLSGFGNGDLREAAASALAALLCGLFWEMWNVWSLAKWVYSVPFVGRFRLFEMPILGYAGYLPFGLECAALADLVLGRWKWERG